MSRKSLPSLSGWIAREVPLVSTANKRDICYPYDVIHQLTQAQTYTRYKSERTHQPVYSDT